MTLFDLTIGFTLLFAAWLIWQNAGFRDRAIALAKQHCDHVDVQLLDDTICLTRLRAKRDQRGNLALSRRYEFEFTATGEQRYRGQLDLLGERLHRIELEAHQIH